ECIEYVCNTDKSTKVHVPDRKLCVTYIKMDERGLLTYTGHVVSRGPTTIVMLLTERSTRPVGPSNSPSPRSSRKRSSPPDPHAFPARRIRSSRCSSKLRCSRP